MVNIVRVFFGVFSSSSTSSFPPFILGARSVYITSQEVAFVASLFS